MSDEQEAIASRSTIGLTSAGEQALAVIMDKKWFATKDSAFKAAVAYAIANNLAPTASGSFNTIWNVGTLDKSGDFSAIVGLVLDQRNPWDAIKRLGDAGIRALAERAPVAEVPTEALLPD